MNFASGDEKILTSLNAPIRGNTLVSFLIRATRSFGTDELKYTYALTEGYQDKKKMSKSVKSDQRKYDIQRNNFFHSLLV